MGDSTVAGTRKTKAEIEGMLRKHFPSQQAKLLAEVIHATSADVTALETWGATIGTKLNTLTTKLNADAGVTDTNYATDFDTTPI